jgi:hypothetical protein
MNKYIIDQQVYNISVLKFLDLDKKLKHQILGQVIIKLEDQDTSQF